MSATKAFHFSRLALIQMHHFLQPIKELLRWVDDDLKPCFCYQGHLCAATLDAFMCPVSNGERWHHRVIVRGNACSKQVREMVKFRSKIITLRHFHAHSSSTCFLAHANV